MASLGRLDGKIALITGASSGIGQGTAILFSKLGAKLAITGRNDANLKKTADECEKNGGVKPLMIVADLSKEEDTIRAVEETIKFYGQLHVLVSSAGIVEVGSVETQTLEQYDKVMNINARPNRQINYKLLDSGESLPKDSKKMLQRYEVLPEEYEIERIITAKYFPKEGDLYLVKWKGFALHDTTWEPKQHIPEADFDKFLNPTISNECLKIYSQIFEDAISTRLTSSNCRTVLSFPTNVFQYLFGCLKTKSVEKADFDKLPLSCHWEKKLNVHGQGLILEFPLKVQPTVTFKKVFLPDINTSTVSAKKIPVEKMVITSSKTAYTL